MKELSRALRAVKNRIRLLHALRGGEWGLIAGGAAALCIVIASFLFPMEARTAALFAVAAGCPALGAAIGAAWPVGRGKVARAADECGLSERVTTALALDGEAPSAFKSVQRQDAMRALSSMSPRERIAVRVVWKRLAAGGGALVLAFSLLLVPNPQDKVLRERAAFRAVMQEEAAAVEEAAEQIDESEYDEETAREIRKILGDLARDLARATDSREALSAVNEAEEKLKKAEMRKPTAAESAMTQAGLSAVADAAQAGEGAMAQALKEAAASSGEGGVADALKEAAEAAEAAGEGEAAEALQKAAEQMEKGDAASAAAALGQATGAASAASGSSTGSGSSGKVAGILSAARTASAQASSSGSGSGAGQGQGQGSGSGSGSGTGQGQGQGTGSGAGQGSTNQDGGASSGGSTSGSAGSRPPQYKTGEYEQIYDPTRLGDGGEVSASTGEVSEEGETAETELGPGLGDASGGVPYDKVYDEYRSSAARSAQRPNLPSYAKDWITKYFDSLID